MKVRNLLSKICLYIIVFFIVIVCLFPLYWAINTSFKSSMEIIQWPPTYFPSNFTLKNYISIFYRNPFPRNILNSLIVAGGTTIFSLLVGSLCAYALARLKVRGKIVILGIILITSMFPSISIVSPLFINIKNLGWLNTYQGLIIPYTTITLPLTIWILSNFFREIPFELEEAALVDGATPLKALWKIIFPLSAPGIVTAGLLVFISSWNELLFAMTFTMDNATRTVPVAITLVERQYEVPWGELTASTVVVTVPLVILVLIFQKRIIAGLTAGAIKG
jgi:multiple sugar transport system permease protein